jgi:hypothetical protein
MTPSPASPEFVPAEPPSPRTWRIFAIPGLLALLGYVALYSCDARLRTRQGPWEVRFLQTEEGTPALRITQPGLGIENVEVRFEGEKVPAETRALPADVRFDQPLAGIPFGRTAFDDLMYLPGTVVLHCFGHEVQLVPRTLYLNRKGYEWTNNVRYDLRGSEKLPSLDPPPKVRRRPGG